MTLALDFGVDITDYDHDAEDRNWGPGWPDCGHTSRNLVTVVAPVSKARFPVHARVARMLSRALDYLELELGYRCRPASCGAFVCRAIAGTRVPSNHSWGLAIDIDWHLNPYRCGASKSIPGEFIAFMESIGWAWGGRYCDLMHFEFMGTPQQADAITQGLLNGNYVPSRPVLSKGDQGRAVEEAQMALGIPVDGVFGDQTEQAVRAFQARHGLPVDGVIGPSTWAVLDPTFNLEDEDTMGAYGWHMPAQLTDDEDRPTKEEHEHAPDPGLFGHLEVVPVPPNDGLGAARGAIVWIQLTAGWQDVHVLGFGIRGVRWEDPQPFTIKAGDTLAYQLPAGARSVEVRYLSALDWSALVEWRVTGDTAEAGFWASPAPSIGDDHPLRAAA